MSGFRVLTEGLFTGSALIEVGGSVGSSGRLGGVAGAAAQTPAAGAWSDFAGRADRTLIDAEQVCGDLARALSEAARAYELSDEAAASSMQAIG